MKKIYIILLCSFLLYSFSVSRCYAGVADTMEKLMHSWVGYSLDELISVWGVPHTEKNIADKRFFYWQYSRQIQVPQYSSTTGNTSSYSNTYGRGNAYISPLGNNIYGNYNSSSTTYGSGNFNSSTVTYGGYMSTYYCNRIIGVDENKIINHWEWNGNYCPRSYRRVKHLVNPKNDLFAQEIANKQAMKAARLAEKQALKEETRAKKEAKKKVKENKENKENKSGS